MFPAAKWARAGLCGLLALAVAVIFGGCAGARPAGVAPAAPLVVTVDRGDIVSTLRVGAVIRARRVARLAFDLPPAGQARVKTVYVKAGQAVQAGQTLAALDTTDLQKEAAAAEKALQAAQRDLERVQAPAGEAELATARLNVIKARLDLLEAQRALERLQQPDISALQAKVEDAEHALALAQLDRELLEHSDDAGKALRDLEYTVAWQSRRLAELGDLVQRGRANLEQAAEYRTLQEQHSKTQSDLAALRRQTAAARASADAAVQRAAESLAQARKDLAAAGSIDPDALDIVRARDAVDAARLALARAEADEAKLKAGPDPDKLAQAQDEVTSKRRALDEARQALARAELKAPFAGVVADLNVQAGDTVSGRTVAATILDLSALQAVASVDEMDIMALRAGMSARITLETFPGEVFTATIDMLPLQGVAEGETLNYEVTLDFDHRGLPLRPGMSALVEFELARAVGVLRLPSMALQKTDAGYSAQLAGGRRVAVQVGLSDDAYTQILAGLNEGDQVIVPATAAGGSTISPGGARP
jgi:HlyD family secretion protein